jgi:hypothetical protein
VVLVQAAVRESTRQVERASVNSDFRHVPSESLDAAKGGCAKNGQAPEWLVQSTTKTSAGRARTMSFHAGH